MKRFWAPGKDPDPKKRYFCYDRENWLPFHACFSCPWSSVFYSGAFYVSFIRLGRRDHVSGAHYGQALVQLHQSRRATSMHTLRDGLKVWAQLPPPIVYKCFLAFSSVLVFIFDTRWSWCRFCRISYKPIKIKFVEIYFRGFLSGVWLGLKLKPYYLFACFCKKKKVEPYLQIKFYR